VAVRGGAATGQGEASATALTRPAHDPKWLWAAR